MQTFGKRQYAYLELDPWATKKKAREKASRKGSVARPKITGYLVALAAVGVLAFASFEMLVLA